MDTARSSHDSQRFGEAVHPDEGRYTSDEQAPILILGMHRSGTSALTGCLRMLGVELGTPLMAAHTSNEAGHFENLDVFAVHEVLLRELGCRWDVAGSLPEGWESGEAAEKATRSIIDIVQRQFVGRGPWAVKDPRMCRLMPVWSRALSSLGMEPRFIHMIRHPLEVARSLQTRDDIGLVTGHLLWLVHHWDAARACREHPHVVLTYDQLLDDPVVAVRDAAAALGVALPRDPLDHAQSLISFARVELKHHHAGGAGDGGPAEPFADFAWIYEQLRNGGMGAIESGADEPARPGRRNDSRAFPLPLGGERLPALPSERRRVAGMLESALDRIGELERRELDFAAQRERRVIASSGVGFVLFAEVVPPGAAAPASEGSREILLVADEWQSVEVELPRPAALHHGQLRFDPLNTAGIVSIASIGLYPATGGEAVWSAQGADLANCTIEGDAFAIAHEDALKVVCTGGDPRILLPVLPDLPDVPLRLKVWLKPSRDQGLLASLWSGLRASHEKVLGELTALQRQVQEHDTTLASSQRDVAELRDALASSQRDAAELRDALASSGREGEELRAAVASAQREAAELRAEADSSRQEADALRIVQREVEELRVSARAREESAREQARALERAERALAEAQEALRRSAHDRNLLVAWLRELSRAFESLMTTRRWRVGDALGRGLAALRFRREMPAAVAAVRSVVAEFEASELARNTPAARRGGESPSQVSSGEETHPSANGHGAT